MAVTDDPMNRFVREPDVTTAAQKLLDDLTKAEVGSFPADSVTLGSESGFVRGLLYDLHNAPVPGHLKGAVSPFLQGTVRLDVARIVRKFLIDVGAYST